MMMEALRLFLRMCDISAQCAKRHPALPDHLRVARAGEEEAYFYLRKHGYTIVARNWISAGRKGEIDLVGWEGEVLCFIEVKSRSTRAVKPAEAAVDRNKQRELKGMARLYLRKYGRRRGARSQAEPPFRFDVVSVYYDGADRTLGEVTLFRGAFA